MDEITTAGFYKKDDNTLLYAPNFVLNKQFELYKEQHESYTYPVEGWYWFNSEEEAYQFFGIQKRE